MLSPRSKKAIVLSLSLLTAFLLSVISLTYLLFLSPDAKTRQIESAGDKNYFVAKRIISDISDVAENDEKIIGLQEAADYDLSDEQKAKTAAKEAKKYYVRLLTKEDVSSETIRQTRMKLNSIEYLLNSADYYGAWIKEARKSVVVIKNTNSSIKNQEEGIKLINKALSEVNDNQNKEALATCDEIISTFKKARSSLVKAKNNYKSHDITKLIASIDLYIDSAKYLKKMANATKYEVDTYNKYVEKLNGSIQKSSRITAKNPLAKDMDNWLEKNFFYKAAKLVFNYKKAEEAWPE